MNKHLVIVESPAKAKTIGRYLGPDYIVEASFGHVRDLPKSGMAIDIEHGFTPEYQISPDKKQRITELKRAAKKVDDVYLASDEDREGEAIAWHLCEALGLDPKKTKRIVFHEITESAIKQALASPRFVDQNLVDAQQARRVLDRLVGYELSPVLWRKIQPGLSAGRVQSVAVRLIVEREREIEAFTASSNFKITGTFTTVSGESVKTEMSRRFSTAEEASVLLEDCRNAIFSVGGVETKPAKRTPAPPFTTSTLQQEASRKLGFGVRQTMTVAQRLYEAGLITYMRTDSVHLSETAQKGAASSISKLYGASYLHERQFSTKSAGAQEAHEAIRPTDFSTPSAGADNGQQRLYELIWKRAIASQMAEAKLERTSAQIAISTRPETFTAKGEVVIFDGFLKVYLASSDDEEETSEDALLPAMQAGQVVQLKTIMAAETFDKPKPRFTEASLVKRLEELGIGRPSTYAPTISTIQDRAYVEKGDLEGNERSVIRLVLEGKEITERNDTERYGADRAKLYPTSIGVTVNDYLVDHFPSIVDLQFTAKAESEFDQIAEGNQPWNRMIGDFYGPFKTKVDAIITPAPGDKTPEELGQGRPERALGTDPKTGNAIIARIGRFGPIVQLGPSEDKRFASIPPNRRIDTITLEEALELFKLPHVLGTTSEGAEIAANFGRFGPYIKWGSKYASIKPDDPFTITLERALELIAAKEQADIEKFILEFPEAKIQVLNGRFGPYITDGKKNAKIPKDTEPASLTLEQCQELLEKAPTRSKRKRFVKSSK